MRSLGHRESSDYCPPALDDPAAFRCNDHGGPAIHNATAHISRAGPLFAHVHIFGKTEESGVWLPGDTRSIRVSGGRSGERPTLRIDFGRLGRCPALITAPALTLGRMGQCPQKPDGAFDGCEERLASNQHDAECGPRTSSNEDATVFNTMNKRTGKGDYHSLYGVLSKGETRGEFECTSTIPVVV